MVRFDKIKILTDKKHVSNIDSDVSTMVIKNNMQQNRFKQTKPYNLYINTNNLDEKCIIEVSAKVLRDRYPELINKNTIHSCLELINATGYCSLDVDGIIRNSQLISCDITRDLGGLNIPDNLSIAFKSCLKNLNRFQVQKFTTSGYTITKLVNTKNRKIRLSLYDKYKELNKATNSSYLDLLDDKYNVLEYFNGKYRLETNVKTLTQIRVLCQTQTNNLYEVLHSTANPLLTIFNSIFELPTNTDVVLNEQQSLLEYRKLSELKDVLLIKACDNDPAQIDLVLNNCLSPSTNKSKYRARLNRLINSQPIPNKNIKLMLTIRAMLELDDEA